MHAGVTTAEEAWHAVRLMCEGHQEKYSNAENSRF